MGYLYKVQENEDLDKYYTKNYVALHCYEKLLEYLPSDDFFLVEPSAGNGSFLKHIKQRCVGFDIKPENEGILYADFLEDDISNHLPKDRNKIAFIGNPPFGKNSSLAVKFLNKCFEYADVVGFILPKTFKKHSVLNRVNLSYSVTYEEELNNDSFVFMGESYSVPCVFQIWTKGERSIVNQKTKTNLFEFVTKDKADFAIRRVGGAAGKVFEEFEDYKEASHYFIKSKIDKQQLKKILQLSAIQMTKKANNCAGYPSLSKPELIEIAEGCSNEADNNE